MLNHVCARMLIGGVAMFSTLTFAGTAEAQTFINIDTGQVVEVLAGEATVFRDGLQVCDGVCRLDGGVTIIAPDIWFAGSWQQIFDQTAVDHGAARRAAYFPLGEGDRVFTRGGRLACRDS